MAKSKKEKPLYDSNGHWVEERGRIKGAIRRAFRLSPQMKEALQKARVELPPKTKKDGDPGKKNQVRYRCVICSGLFSQKNVQVDHLIPVVSLWKKESDMTYDEIVRGVFSSVDNLQVICSTPKKRLEPGQSSSCHSQKTNEENYLRDRLTIVPGIEKDIDFVSIVEKMKINYKTHLISQEKLLEEKRIRKLAREAKKKKIV